MLTKESFIEASKKIPFKVENIEGVGDVGIRLMRDGELQEFLELETNIQLREIIISDKGECVFSKDDINLVKDKFARAQKMDIFTAWRKVNKYEESHEEKKSN